MDRQVAAIVVLATACTVPPTKTSRYSRVKRTMQGGVSDMAAHQTDVHVERRLQQSPNMWLGTISCPSAQCNQDMSQARAGKDYPLIGTYHAVHAPQHSWRRPHLPGQPGRACRGRKSRPAGGVPRPAAPGSVSDCSARLPLWLRLSGWQCPAASVRQAPPRSALAPAALKVLETGKLLFHTNLCDSRGKGKRADVHIAW